MVSHGFRCIDPTHGLGCTRCTPAPSLEEENDYQLVGDPGRKNGEKKLRALLSRTTEWASQTERNRLAELYDGVAESKNLSVVLRYKQTAGLRKVHLFLLARAWHYASDLWVRRDSHGLSGPARSQSAPPLLPTAFHPAGLKELPARISSGSAPSSSLDEASDCVQEHISSVLEPIAYECSRLFAGLEAKGALSEPSSHSAVHNLAERFQDMQVATAELSSLLVFWHVQRASLVQWRCELTGDVTLDSAWRALAGSRVAPMENMLLKIDSALRMSIASYQHQAPEPRPGRSAANAERVWLDEIYRARQLQLEIVSRTVMLLTTGKQQSVEAYVRSAVLLLDFLITYTAMVISNLAVRQTWMEALLGTGPQAPLASAAAAAGPGNPSPSAPLVASAAPLA